MTEEKIDRTVEDLLAIIHRDGGHYIHDNGYQAAINEACRVIPAERGMYEGIHARGFEAGMKTGTAVAYMTAKGEQPIEGEVDALIAKIKNYQTALGRIAEGFHSPMLLARAVLDGAPGDVN